VRGALPLLKFDMNQSCDCAVQSAVSREILKQETARPAADNMKWRTALIEPSQFDWSEAKLSG
jgi:hypothetical protein